MHECFKTVPDDDGDSKAQFFISFSHYFEKMLCHGEFDEKIYLRDLSQLRDNFDEYAILNESKY